MSRSIGATSRCLLAASQLSRSIATSALNQPVSSSRASVSSPSTTLAEACSGTTSRPSVSAGITVRLSQPLCSRRSMRSILARQSSTTSANGCSSKNRPPTGVRRRWLPRLPMLFFPQAVSGSTQANVNISSTKSLRASLSPSTTCKVLLHGVPSMLSSRPRSQRPRLSACPRLK